MSSFKLADDPNKDINALKLYMAKQSLQNKSQADQEQKRSGNILQRQMSRQQFMTERDVKKDAMARQLNIHKAQTNEASKRRQALDSYSGDANQILVALDKMEKGAHSLGDFKRGPWEQLKARAQVGVGSFSKDKNLTRYQGVMSQEFIPLARKLMEEKGPITESDVKRVERGLGDITTPLEDKIFLINEMRNKVKQALKHKMALREGSNLDTRYTELLERAEPMPMEEDAGGDNGDVRERYNQLRARGLSAEEAKRELGL